MNERYEYITTGCSTTVVRQLPMLHVLQFLITIFILSSTLVTHSFQWSYNHHYHHRTTTTAMRIPNDDPYCRIRQFQQQRQQQQQQQLVENSNSQRNHISTSLSFSNSDTTVISSLYHHQSQHHTTTTTTNSGPSCRTKLSSAVMTTRQLSNIQLSLSSSGNTNTNDLMSIRQGSTVALITPFHEDTGKVDYDSLQSLVRYHMNSGTDNLCVLGTTGEAGVLSMEERQQVLTTVATMVKGKIPVMVGCGTINPHHVQEMIQQAADCGCDAALVVTPYYVKPPQRSLIQHYTVLADRSPIPLIIYNVPGRTAVDMSDESIAIAANHPNIVAVKDATGKLERLASLQQQLIKQNVNDTGNKNEKFLLFSGDDETSMEYTLQGGDGCISVTANIAAKAMHDIMISSLSNDRTTATKLNDPLVPLHSKLFCESNPMPVKYAASKINLITSSFCRPPLDVLDTTRYGTVVDDALRHAGLLL